MEFAIAFCPILFSFIFLCITSGYSDPDHICDYKIKLEQELYGEGFHRNITYSLDFDFGNNYKWIFKNCRVGLDQYLPEGVYVNPDELRELKRVHKVIAIPKNRINVELPARESTPNNIYLLSNIVNAAAFMWMPLHARYHHAKAGGGNALNELKPPQVYINCPDDRLDICHGDSAPPGRFLCNEDYQQKCNWNEVPYTLIDKGLDWEVPVGNMDHYYLVATITFIVVAAGSFYLLNTLHVHKVSEERRRQMMKKHQ